MQHLKQLQPKQLKLIQLKRIKPKQKKRTAYIVCAMASAMVLSGCATMSAKECKVADWQAIGETDGARGALPNYLTNHKKACGELGIAPNKALWEKGRQQGLKDYCTSLNAYIVGRNGGSLSPVCGFVGRVKLLELHERYSEGRQRYVFEKQMDDLHETWLEHKFYHHKR